jgi:Rod binding domain-containing protein
MIDAVSSGVPGAAAEAAKQNRLADAAGQFEALLLGQLLKSMREAGSGWLGTGEDQASEAAMELAEEQFALALAARGGLGLAALTIKGLTQPRPSGATGGTAGSLRAETMVAKPAEGPLESR